MPEPRKLRVFLCHSSNDKPAVRELYQRLKAEGWIDPWLDEEKLYPGQDWELEIEKAVVATDAVIVCLSNNSVTKEGYVHRELRFVLRMANYKPEGTVFVIPIRLDDSPIPRRLSTWQYVDFFPVDRKDWAYQRLMYSLKVNAERLGIPTINQAEEQERRGAELKATKEKEMIEKMKASAYDFLSMRFNSESLLARYDDGRLKIDVEKHHVLIEGEKIKLTPVEFRLLVYLASNAGMVLFFDQILMAVWGKEYKGHDDYVHVYVAHLRNKIEEDKKSPRYIQSVDEVGYIFETQGYVTLPYGSKK